jgi:molecular chaperone GrpE
MPLEEKNKIADNKEEKELSSEELKKKLEECQKLKDDYLAGWQRARADFSNYKKDESERAAGLVKYIQAGLILNILPILDNFELLKKNLPSDLKENQYVKAVFQLRKQVINLLKSQAVQRIKGVGERFDPNFHHVVAQEAAEGKEPGIILEIVQQGYLLQGKVLRPAKVKVAE